MMRLPPASIDLVFADPPYNLQLEGALSRPDQSVVDGVDDSWDKFADFAEYDAFTRDWLTAVRRLMKPSATIVVIGSYHNIFRVGRDPAGSGLLDPQRHRLAQGQPDAELPRPPVHQRPRDDDLGRAQPEAKAYTFNYETLKAGNEDVQVRSDWFLPICTGAERLKDESGRKAHPTQKPEHCCSGCCWPPPTQAIWCSIRFSAPGPPGSPPGASAVRHRPRAGSGLRRSGARADRRGRALA